ncbi:hypothetical protein [Neokomagataea thailandica]|nr:MULTISPECIES: hypothetical protein [Neokomagataea]
MMIFPRLAYTELPSLAGLLYINNDQIKEWVIKTYSLPKKYLDDSMALTLGHIESIVGERKYFGYCIRHAPINFIKYFIDYAAIMLDARFAQYRGQQYKLHAFFLRAHQVGLGTP